MSFLMNLLERIFVLQKIILYVYNQAVIKDVSSFYKKGKLKDDFSLSVKECRT